MFDMQVKNVRDSAELLLLHKPQCEAKLALSLILLAF